MDPCAHGAQAFPLGILLLVCKSVILPLLPLVSAPGVQMAARNTVCLWLVDHLGVVVSLHEGPVRALLRVEAVCYLPFVGRWRSASRAPQAPNSRTRDDGSSGSLHKGAQPHREVLPEALAKLAASAMADSNSISASTANRPHVLGACGQGILRTRCAGSRNCASLDGTPY